MDSEKLQRQIERLNSRFGKKSSKYELKVTELRPYQIDVLKKALQCEFDEGKRAWNNRVITSPTQVINAPVGYGKTLIACTIIKVAKALFGLHRTVKRHVAVGTHPHSFETVTTVPRFENMIICSSGTASMWEKHLKLVGIKPEVVKVPSDLPKLTDSKKSTILITNNILAKSRIKNGGMVYRLFFDEPDTQHVPGFEMTAKYYYMISATIDFVLDLKARFPKKHLIPWLFAGSDPLIFSICNGDRKVNHTRTRIDKNHECFDRTVDLFCDLEVPIDVRRAICAGLPYKAIKSLCPDLNDEERNKMSVINAVRSYFEKKRKICFGRKNGAETEGYKKYDSMLKKFETMAQMRRCESCGYAASEFRKCLICHQAYVCQKCRINAFESKECPHEHDLLLKGFYNKCASISRKSSSTPPDIKCLKTIFEFCTIEAPYTAIEKNSVIVQEMGRPLEPMKRKGLVFDYFENEKLLTDLSEAGIKFASFEGGVNKRAKIIEKLKTGEIEIIVFKKKEDMAGLDIPFATDVFICSQMDDNHEQQCIGRALRYGYDHPVTVHRILQLDE